MGGRESASGGHVTKTKKGDADGQTVARARREATGERHTHSVVFTAHQRTRKDVFCGV